jgi:hypothetical protein
MPEEVAGQVVQETQAAPQSAPQPEADPAPKAATPEADTEAADKADEEKSQDSEEPRKFTQDELDAIVRKEKARAEAKAERRALKAYRETLERLVPQQQPTVQGDGKPFREQYASDSDFVEALTDWKLEQRDLAARREAQRYAHKSLTEKTESIYAKAERLPGFDREAFDELPITRPLAEAIIEADAPERVMAFLASNPEEVERIAALSPARQAAEVGRLEAKLAAAPKVSNAPQPIKPIGTRGTASNNDPEHMSQAEYEALRRKQGAPWAPKR